MCSPLKYTTKQRERKREENLSLESEDENLTPIPTWKINFQVLINKIKPIISEDRESGTPKPLQFIRKHFAMVRNTGKINWKY